MRIISYLIDNKQKLLGVQRSYKTQHIQYRLDPNN